MLMVTLLLTPLAFCGCQSAAGESFAIYLTKNKILAAQVPALNHIELADAPLISGDDIILYYRDTHEIELTPEAFERLKAFTVPTFGEVFVVCVDKQPVYSGVFRVAWSSYLNQGVSITIPFLSKSNTIQLGFLNLDDSPLEDPRSNLVIMESLEKSGKLK